MTDLPTPANRYTREDLQRLVEDGKPVDAAHLRRALRLLDDAECECERAEGALSDARGDLHDAEYELGCLRDRLHADNVGPLTVVGVGRTDDELLRAAARLEDVIVLTGNPVAIGRALRLYGHPVTLQLVDGTS